uniref:Uncharacterized protein n=1 Tax=Oryza nivara TaxID=4536 RepID=A0A0E0GKM1_ORYNI
MRVSAKVMFGTHSCIDPLRYPTSPEAFIREAAQHNATPRFRLSTRRRLPRRLAAAAAVARRRPCGTIGATSLYTPPPPQRREEQGGRPPCCAGACGICTRCGLLGGSLGRSPARSKVQHFFDPEASRQKLPNRVQHRILSLALKENLLSQEAMFRKFCLEL